MLREDLEPSRGASIRVEPTSGSSVPNQTTVVERKKKLWLFATRSAGMALAVLILWLAFHEVQASRVAQLLVGIGLWIIVIPLPQLVSFSCETLGWRRAFGLLGRRVRLLPLLRVRISTDALTHSLPAGVLLCESTTPFLLRGYCHVPFAEGIAATAARKYLLLVSQAIYVALIFLFGFSTLRQSSVGIIGSAGLPWIVAAISLLLALAASGVSAGLQHGAVVSRVHALLRRVPIQSWRSFLEEKRARFTQTDSEMARFFGASRLRKTPAALWFLAGWISESLETYLILRLLGVELSFTAVASFEVILAFLRHTLVFLPAGLGVQDAGYAAFLAALGVPNALHVGAAFVVLKRSKEVLWAALGYALLLAARGRSRQASQQLAVEQRLGVDSA
jgi:uncharacterized membrane protein YbhN (UPF0104 family)